MTDDDTLKIPLPTGGVLDVEPLPPESACDLHDLPCAEACERLRALLSDSGATLAVCVECIERTRDYLGRKLGRG